MRRGGERGSAAVELALALPAAVGCLAFGLGAVQAAAAGIAAPAAALAGARTALVAGDESAVSAATRAAGAGATASVARADGWVEVTVAIHLGWPWGERSAVSALPLQGR